MFFPIMPSLVCVHDNKMTHGPVCGCNDVFGVQDYHIAGTRWLRRDRKSAVCFFFFCEIAFDNHFYSLIGLLRNITTTRLGEDENYFFYFPFIELSPQKKARREKKALKERYAFK